MWLLFSLAATAAEIDGSWSLANSPDTVKAEISRGVNASVAAFPKAYQSMVRSRLSAVPEVCDGYEFRVDDDQVAWRCDRKREIIVPRNQLGVPFQIRHGGKRVQATVTLEGDTLHAKFEGKDGDRTVVFSFVDDTMRTTVTVRAPQLKVPLTWSVFYARQSD